MPIYAHWIIFSAFLIFIFFSFITLLSHVWKKNQPTDKQKRTCLFNFLKYVVFYWLIDFFYMACFNDWLDWKFVFGCLLIIFIFYNLTDAFLNQNKKNWLTRLFLLQDFLVGVGMTIYLLYIIPCKPLQEVLVPIISAIYGGLITLVGVAWTIKFTKNESLFSKIEENKPLIFCDPLDSGKDFIPIHFCEFSKGNREMISIVNSDKVQFLIKSIKVNETTFEVQGINFLNKGQKAHLYFKMDEGTEIRRILLNIESIDNFSYSYELFLRSTNSVKRTLLVEQIKEVRLSH